MPAAYFEIDEKLNDTLIYLKVSLGASSTSKVLRTAIALLKVVKEANDNGSTVVIHSSNNKAPDQTIIL